MKVLLLHNRYRQFGGEDVVAEAEARLLKANGADVIEVGFDNGDSEQPKLVSLCRQGLESSWSRTSYRFVRRLCEKHRPDIAHVHNFWTRLTPAVHTALHECGVPTVQTLHNYRLLCPSATFMRDGQLCLDCLGKTPWRGVLHRCYRDSALASLAAARMIVSNRIRGTWERHVDAFIALSGHGYATFVAGQLPPDRIFVKPNFCEDPGDPSSLPSASKRILYLGRLAKEKGVSLLVAAWKHGDLGRHGQLVSAGDGPERLSLEAQIQDLGISSSVCLTGPKSRAAVPELLRNARATVLPSIWYEPLAVSIIESFSHGRPVVASDLGSLRETVRNNGSGLTFETGNVGGLAAVLEKLLTSGDLADRLGKNARREYLSQYTPEQNLGTLLRIYRFAIERHGKKAPALLEELCPAGVGAEKPLAPRVAAIA